MVYLLAFALQWNFICNSHPIRHEAHSPQRISQTRIHILRLIDCESWAILSADFICGERSIAFSASWRSSMADEMSHCSTNEQAFGHTRPYSDLLFADQYFSKRPFQPNRKFIHAHPPAHSIFMNFICYLYYIVSDTINDNQMHMAWHFVDNVTQCLVAATVWHQCHLTNEQELAGKILFFMNSLWRICPFFHDSFAIHSENFFMKLFKFGRVFAFSLNFDLFEFFLLTQNFSAIFFLGN